MTGNGSVHGMVHGDPWTQDGVPAGRLLGAYPLGCRQQVSNMNSTNPLVQALLYSFAGFCRLVVLAYIVKECRFGRQAVPGVDHIDKSC